MNFYIVTFALPNEDGTINDHPEVNARLRVHATSKAAAVKTAMAEYRRIHGLPSGFSLQSFYRGATEVAYKVGDVIPA